MGVLAEPGRRRGPALRKGRTHVDLSRWGLWVGFVFWFLKNTCRSTGSCEDGREVPWTFHPASTVVTSWEIIVQYQNQAFDVGTVCVCFCVTLSLRRFVEASLSQDTELLHHTGDFLWAPLKPHWPPCPLICFPSLIILAVQEYYVNAVI